ncbi:allophanate hydrolase [Frankia sp. R82]|uniref:allophanate hydrolase n=1 Tax=Frankia sp. R82 TaxID=2950553 RepID=UPI002044B884|nr:allophanate hydrolase [Frankia sp. R82]MCM3884092.1 allophanate hydrolase [Frankia sp. R82]
MTTDLPDAPSASRPPQALDLQAAVLHAGYRCGALRVGEVIAAVYDRIEARGDDAVWISLVPREQAMARAAALDATRDALFGPAGGGRAASDEPAPTGAAPQLPALFGLPFAVKDNIDVAGLPTTAGCPEFAREPDTDAPAVAALLAAGAVCLGKTNLDQFATGLSGARSPYGTPVSPFDPTMIAGGSSSGSGVAVAAGLVTFAIGTDTAGSGRVPAALTNVVGIKPSRGLVSTRGLVPACRSLDCLSVFALSVADARLALSVMAGYDPADPYSRRLPAVTALGQGTSSASARGLRVAVARPQDLVFFGDDGARAVHEHGRALLRDLGAELTLVDLEPFLAAGRLLYEGPWLAERFASVGEFVLARPGEVHPTVRAVIEPGATITGVEVHRGLARLRALRRQVEQLWQDVDALVLPTVPTSYPVASVLADPIGLNSRLGRYTTFANLLDLAAVAVPVGFSGGLPHGVTLMAPAGQDAFLADLGARLHARTGLPTGATDHPLARPGQDFVDLAVVGAHLSGLPLNGELTRTGGVLVRRDRTLPCYRLFALPGGPPRRPGLLRTAEGGAAIEVEVWRLPAQGVGRFLLGVPAPLAIGTVELAGGPTLGFLCESVAVDGAEDITALGGWRPYLAITGPRPAPVDVP